MGIAERRAREKEALRRAIIDAATELIVKEGYANLSIRKIADKIEHAPSTIYLYFRDKLSILTAICQEVFTELSAKLEDLARTEPDPALGIKRGLTCYIRFGLSHPQHYIVTFLTPYPPEAEMVVEQGEFGSVGIQCFDNLRRAVRRGIDAGVVRPGDVNLVSQSLWTAIHGLTSILITMGHDKSFPWAPQDELIEYHVDMLWRGIALDSAHGSS